MEEIREDLLGMLKEFWETLDVTKLRDEVCNMCGLDLKEDAPVAEKSQKVSSAVGSYAVIYGYKGENDVAVYLHDTLEDAKKHLKESCLSRYSAAMDRNHAFECKPNKDWTEVLIHERDNDGVHSTTDLRIGRVYQ